MVTFKPTREDTRRALEDLQSSCTDCAVLYEVSTLKESLESLDSIDAPDHEYQHLLSQVEELKS